jgi:hypothetical protein
VRVNHLSGAAAVEGVRPLSRALRDGRNDERLALTPGGRHCLVEPERRDRSDITPHTPLGGRVHRLIRTTKSTLMTPPNAGPAYGTGDRVAASRTFALGNVGSDGPASGRLRQRGQILVTPV